MLEKWRATMNSRNGGFVLQAVTVHSSVNFQYISIYVVFFCSCDKVFYKQEVSFLFYLLGQIVTWQYNPNPLD